MTNGESFVFSENSFYVSAMCEKRSRRREQNKGLRAPGEKKIDVRFREMEHDQDAARISRQATNHHKQSSKAQ